MKPILKWVGGKTQILDRVLEKFPTEIEGDYYEPFVGGGSVLLAVLPRVKGRVYASDANAHLIELYLKIQRDPEGLIRELAALETDQTEQRYYEVRDAFNAAGRTFSKPAFLVYLNKLGFRGLYREGPNGFNVPYGHPKAPVSLCDPENVRSVSRAIQRVTFTHEPYEHALQRVTPCDFVYLDPPYVPETKTGFTGYVRGEFDHDAFFARVKSLPCPWVMSNSGTEMVRREFPRCVDVDARRAIHSRNPGARTVEVLVSSP